jgi:hypothetical protein
LRDPAVLRANRLQVRERLDLFTGAPLNESAFKREPEMRQWMGLASPRIVRVGRFGRAAVASAFLSVGIVSVAVSASGQAAKPAAAAAPKTTAAKDAGAPVATSGDAGTSGATAAGSAGTSSTPVAGGPAVPIPDKGAMDGATYSVRLRDLEARVDELKDQIRS